MNTPPVESENNLLDCLRHLLSELGMKFKLSADRDFTFSDAVLSLPDLNLQFLVEAKRSVYPKLIDERDALARSAGLPLILVSSGASEKTFTYCRNKNVGLVTADGNAYINVLPLFIDRYRKIKSAKPQTAGSIFTPKSSRIARALLSEPQRAWSQGELKTATGASQSQVSKVLKSLNNDGIISFDGTTHLHDPDRLLDDWSAHYRFDRHSRFDFAMSSQDYGSGLKKLASELERLGIRFAFTGWSGAFLRAPYGTAVDYMAFVERIPEREELKSLIPVVISGNVSLYIPQDEGVFQFNSGIEKLRVVSDVQLYLDLSCMPGRATDQADHLRSQLLKFDRD